MDDYASMDRFFSGVMKVQKGGPNKIGIDAPEDALKYDIKADSPLARDDTVDGAMEGGDAAL